jgi:hypothetical protein
MSMPHEQRVTEIGTAVANAVGSTQRFFSPRGLFLCCLEPWRSLYRCLQP